MADEKENIQLDGFNYVEPIEKSEALSLAEKTYERIARKIKNNFLIHIHLKQHKHAQNSKTQYEVKAKVDAPGLFFEANSTEWSLLAAVNEALERLEKELMHNLGKR